MWKVLRTMKKSWSLLLVLVISFFFVRVFFNRHVDYLEINEQDVTHIKNSNNNNKANNNRNRITTTTITNNNNNNTSKVKANTTNTTNNKDKFSVRSANNKETSAAKKTTMMSNMNSSVPATPSLKDLLQKSDSLALNFTSVHQNFLIWYFHLNGLRPTPDVGLRHPEELTEVEKRYLATPDLTDTSFLPEEMTSQVQLVTTQHHYRIGDDITIRVTLNDQLGRPRTTGGDEVRIWLTCPDQGHSRPVKVVDLGNGSYVGKVTLRWMGPTFVLASLTYSREVLRTLVLLRHAILTTRWITMVFARQVQGQAVTERTPCLPSFPIPGYASTCNLTLYNDLDPWYCGMPSDPKLTCEDVTHSGNLPFVVPLPLPPAHLQMIKELDGERNHPLRLIPNNITINTLPGPRASRKQPCASLPARLSWEPLSHFGWLEKHAWRPDSCALPDISSKIARACFGNTSVLALGDSNMRFMFNMLKHLVTVGKTVNAWHAPYLFEVPELNSSLMFTPHARPFNPGSSDVTLTTLSLSAALKRLPQHDNYVILLHYYLHFTFLPLHVYRDRMRRAKQALEVFLLAHPAAKVFIRGPHVVYDGQPGFQAQFAGDKWGPWYLDILREEMEDLKDKVVLLDLWPLTIATENNEMHPPELTLIQMMRIFLGYACGHLVADGSSS